MKSAENFSYLNFPLHSLQFLFLFFMCLEQPTLPVSFTVLRNSSTWMHSALLLNGLSLNAKCSLLNGLSCPAVMTQRITLMLRAQRSLVTTEVTTVNKHSVRAKLWTQIWLNLNHLDLELLGDPWKSSGWLPPTGKGRRAPSSICTPLFFALTERRHRLQELLHWLLPKGLGGG